MTILAIDTSAGVSVALVQDGQILAEHNVDSHGVQGEMTAHLVSTVLMDSGKQPEDVTQVVVGVGPGPFTGLRVGIACATVFAFARNIPAHGLCSLDAVAYEYGQPCVVVTNARRSELYWAQYPSTHVRDRTHGPGVSKPEDLRKLFPDADYVGPGVAVYPEVVDGKALPLRAASLALLFQSGGAEVLPLSPLYLRPPDATEPGKPKSVLS